MVKIKLGGDNLGFVGINDIKGKLDEGCCTEEDVMWSSFGNEYTKVKFNNSIIGTIFTAWNAHYNLVLDPDSVWLAICLPFSRYIYNNSEDLRKSFVDHEGQTELKVSLDHIEPNMAIEALVNEIVKNIKDPDFVPLLESNFTTTNIVSKNLSKLGIMKAMANYFSYKCCACCGLKSVELTGTRNDWVSIKNKIEAMKKYDVDGTVVKWTDLLHKVIDKFIEAFDGVVDSEFWNKIALESMGSGSSHLTGWLIVFNPYSTSGRYLLGNSIYGMVSEDDICDCTIEVDMDVDDNGYEYKSKLRGGFYGCKLDGETISPRFGYGMYKKSDPVKAYSVTDTKIKYVEYENGKFKSVGECPPLPHEDITVNAMYMKLYNASECTLIKVDKYKSIARLKVGDKYVHKVSYNTKDAVEMSIDDYTKMYFEDLGQIVKVFKYETYRYRDKASYSYDIEYGPGKFFSDIDYNSRMVQLRDSVLTYLEEKYGFVEISKSDYIIHKMKTKGYIPAKVLKCDRKSYDYDAKANVMKTVYALVFSDGSVVGVDGEDYGLPVDRVTNDVFSGLINKTGCIW